MNPSTKQQFPVLSLEVTQHTIQPHIFEYRQLLSRRGHALPTGLLANLILDAANHCDKCRQELDGMLTTRHLTSN